MSAPSTPAPANAGMSWKLKVLIAVAVAGLIAWWGIDSNLRFGLWGWAAGAAFLITLFFLSGVIGWTMKHPVATLIGLVAFLYGGVYLWQTLSEGRPPFGSWMTPETQAKFGETGELMDPFNLALILVAGAGGLFFLWKAWENGRKNREEAKKKKAEAAKHKGSGH